ncbi:MAG: hypothetical protein ACXVPU_18050 [Bacteroidia bacterium]
MNTAILISFVIPAIVATVLTIMLIKERDYFFRNKQNYGSLEPEERKEYKEHKRTSADIDNLDFSGGTFGL